MLNKNLLFHFRFITIIYYLSNVEDGGETAFPVADDPDYDHDVRQFV